MLKIFKLTLINIVVFLFLYLLVEISTGNFLFNKKEKLDCSYLLCDRKMIFKNVSLNKKAQNYDVLYTKDKFGFRGRKKNLDKIDILTIGGSTTDERFLKIEDTWSEKLEKKFEIIYQNFDVVNAGIDGQSTNGHLWNFTNWFNKIENFKPKYIIFYIGVNERLSSHVTLYKKSNLVDNGNDFSNLGIFKKVEFFLKKNNGLTYKAYILLYRSFFLKDEHNVGHNNLRKKIDYIKPFEKIEISDLTKEAFINNMKKLNEYSLRLDAKPIFVTQKTRRGLKRKNQIYSISTSDYYEYEKKVSDIIISFCKKHSIYCVNLNEKLDFDEHDTYDLVHVTPSGAEKIANIIFENTRNYIKPYNN